MDLKFGLMLCLFLLSANFLDVDAQRDGRRRTGKRKPTTEIPKEPAEEPEGEISPQKIDSEPESIEKSSNSQPAEPEKPLEPPSIEKESINNTQGGPPFIVPRGTRKPRPMHVRNNGVQRPRPTLPTFSRKSNRRPKPERPVSKNADENSVASASTSSTTAKPARNSSRRRNNNASTSERGSNPERAPQPAGHSESSTDPAPKKRFGGATRRPVRGSRRITPAPIES